LFSLDKLQTKQTQLTFGVVATDFVAYVEFILQSLHFRGTSPRLWRSLCIHVALG